MKHTPGPWELDDGAVTHQGAAIARVYNEFDFPCLDPEDDSFQGAIDAMQADARLIAAAPDMLELLENIKFWLERYGKEMPDGAAEMHAGVSWVIGKAKGESV